MGEGPALDGRLDLTNKHPFFKETRMPVVSRSNGEMTSIHNFQGSVHFYHKYVFLSTTFECPCYAAD